MEKTYTVYILKSEKDGRYYIGQTDNLVRRISKHNSGKNRSTKAYRPWVLVYKEILLTRRDAMKREKELKSYKKRKILEKLFK